MSTVSLRDVRDLGRLKERGCEGKQRMGEKHARRAARMLNSRQAESVHAYPCPWCRGGWHVGSDEGITP